MHCCSVLTCYAEYYPHEKTCIYLILYQVGMITISQKLFIYNDINDCYKSGSYIISSYVNKMTDDDF